MKVNNCKSFGAVVIIRGMDLADVRLLLLVQEIHSFTFTHLVQTSGTKIRETIGFTIHQWVRRRTIFERIDWYFSFRFDHPHILAGQGSLGLEILDQVPDVDAIIIPTGN